MANKVPTTWFTWTLYCIALSAIKGSSGLSREWSRTLPLQTGYGQYLNCRFSLSQCDSSSLFLRAYNSYKSQLIIIWTPGQRRLLQIITGDVPPVTWRPMGAQVKYCSTSQAAERRDGSYQWNHLPCSFYWYTQTAAVVKGVLHWFALSFV